MIPACDIHEPGDPTCHWPRPVPVVTPEVYAPPSLYAQVLDLKWELGFWLLLLGSIGGYIALS